MSENFNFWTNKGNLIRATIYGRRNFILNPCIIFVHGFKDWGFGSFIDEYLENKGYSIITFNFSHNGVGEDLTEFAHGDQDVSVSVEEAEKIYGWSDKYQTEFYKIAATNHTFGIIHPFARSNAKFEKLLEKTNNFFKTNLI